MGEDDDWDLWLNKQPLYRYGKKPARSFRPQPQSPPRPISESSHKQSKESLKSALKKTKSGKKTAKPRKEVRFPVDLTSGKSKPKPKSPPKIRFDTPLPSAKPISPSKKRSTTKRDSVLSVFSFDPSPNLGRPVSSQLPAPESKSGKKTGKPRKEARFPAGLASDKSKHKPNSPRKIRFDTPLPREIPPSSFKRRSTTKSDNAPPAVLFDPSPNLGRPVSSQLVAQTPLVSRETTKSESPRPGWSLDTLSFSGGSQEFSPSQNYIQSVASSANTARQRAGSRKPAHSKLIALNKKKRREKPHQDKPRHAVEPKPKPFASSSVPDELSQESDNADILQSSAQVAIAQAIEKESDKPDSLQSSAQVAIAQAIETLASRVQQVPNQIKEAVDSALDKRLSPRVPVTEKSDSEVEVLDLLERVLRMNIPSPAKVIERPEVTSSQVQHLVDQAIQKRQEQLLQETREREIERLEELEILTMAKKFQLQEKNKRKRQDQRDADEALSPSSDKVPIFDVTGEMHYVPYRNAATTSPARSRRLSKRRRASTSMHCRKRKVPVLPSAGQLLATEDDVLGYMLKETRPMPWEEYGRKADGCAFMIL